MDSIEQARRSVAEAGRALLAAGLVARTWGNVSCRLSGDSFVITPSGLGYAGMTAADTVVFEMGDNSWRGSRPPSGEWGVHRAAYQRFPATGFVIHTHQTYATALGLAGFDSWQRTAAEDATLGGVALAAYGRPGSKQLRRQVDAALATGAQTLLMAHHGALILGRDQEEAFARAQLLEQLCRAACRAQIPAEAGDSHALAELAAALSRPGRPVAAEADPLLIQASLTGQPLYAQLDDMAQLIGCRLDIIDPEPRRAAAALRRRDAVLVRGLGALFCARTEDDLAALSLIVTKACLCRLHTAAWGCDPRLNPLDALRMRRHYCRHYARMINAAPGQS